MDVEQGILNKEVDLVPLPFDNAQDWAGVTKGGENIDY